MLFIEFKIIIEIKKTINKLEWSQLKFGFKNEN